MPAPLPIMAASAACECVRRSNCDLELKLKLPHGMSVSKTLRTNQNATIFSKNAPKSRIHPLALSVQRISLTLQAFSLIDPALRSTSLACGLDR
jgi:uncharacterized HAD superfamily protein